MSPGEIASAPRQRVVIYGAGGHGKVVADMVLAMGAAEVLGFVDDGAGAAGRTVLGMPVLGAGDWAEREADVAVALAIGSNRARRAAAERCQRWGATLLTVVHPRSTVARSAVLAPGVVVMAGAVINPEAFVGEGAIVNTSAVVEHDVVVGAFAHLSPHATTGGAARIGALAHVGLSATVLPGVSVGEGAVVGAGAVVIRDVAPGETVVGIPAKALVRR
jgi:sugar O-acyltransferase (sialic acid O-acetyltransferase NeuD family)